MYLDWDALMTLLLDEVDLINLLGRVILLHVEVPVGKIKSELNKQYIDVF